MKELFFQFLESPNRNSYIAIRDVVLASELYDPYSMEMDEVDALILEEKFAEAQEMLAAAMPNLLLSPQAHLMHSYIADRTGEAKAAQMEAFVAATCCEGILTTGEGSKSQPYLVLRTSDEHDIVRYLDKKFAGQALVHDGDRHLDHVRCDDDFEIWFDITDAYNKLGESFGNNS